MEAHVDNDIPQWKKDLIARLRSQNKTAVGSGDQQQQQLSTVSTSPQHSCSRAVHQPSSTYKSDSVSSGVSSASIGEPQCDVISTCPQPAQSKMVQERVWVDNKHDPFIDMINENYNNNGYHKDSDSDSSEDLHYGPGIVNKLKNKYLSLALRENNRIRPSILHMRKATSLENLLDDDAPEETRGNRHYQSRLNGNDTGRSVPNRYRNVARGEMKRARSVEAISRYDHHIPLITNRQSLHEEMLIAAKKEVSHNNKIDSQLETIEKFSNHSGHRISRPKRIQPLMNEREKPPTDVVKQTKMIFERRPEQRTRAPPQTGDVAAKVDSFNNIIVKAKVEAKVISKKPPIKQTKPVLNDKVKNTRPVAKPVIVSEEVLKVPPKTLDLNKGPTKKDLGDVQLPSPIPDVSRIDFHNKGDMERGKNTTSLSETPDLILVSSPLPPASSPTYKKNPSEMFIREEIRISSPILRSPLLSPIRVASPILSPSRANPVLSPLRPSIESDVADNGFKISSPNSNGIGKHGGTSVFNFTSQNVNQSHLPTNKNVSTVKTPPSQPLKIEINGYYETKIQTPSPKLLLTQSPKSPPLPARKTDTVLTVTELEKNLINSVKTLQQPSVVCVNSSVEVVNRNVVPKKAGRPREQASNTAVFNFTNRKDVPDYISNDRSRMPGRPELPKPGEGGIILIPGATISDSFTDEDEEILRSLEQPPSPCDVTFINDNILIDGKSSLSQKTKQMKLRISFVDAGPDVFEYPSENSLLLDESPPSPSPSQIGHTVPNLSGSTLANYTPKAMEEFHPGITRSPQQIIPNKPDVTEVDATVELIVEDIDMPFSSGANADILF